MSVDRKATELNMRFLVTGSAGHLGEALVRTLRAAKHEVIGLDIQASEYTDALGSIVDSSFVDRCVDGVGPVAQVCTEQLGRQLPHHCEL